MALGPRERIGRKLLVLFFLIYKSTSIVLFTNYVYIYVDTCIISRVMTRQIYKYRIFEFD